MAELTQPILPMLRQYGTYDYDTLLRELDEARGILEATFRRLDTLYAAAGGGVTYLTETSGDARYYTKLEIDAAHAAIAALYYTKAEIDSTFTGYYTKVEVDTNTYTQAAADLLLDAKMPIAGGDFTGPITVSGNAVLDGGRPRFQARGAGPGYCAAETLWVPTADFAIGGGFASGVYTCPVAGYYVIGAKYLSEIGYGAYSALKKSGVAVDHTHSNITSHTMQHHFWSGYCTAGTTFGIYVQASYGIYATDARFNAFWGALVG